MQILPYFYSYCLSKSRRRAVSTYWYWSLFPVERWEFWQRTQIVIIILKLVLWGLNYFTVSEIEFILVSQGRANWIYSFGVEQTPASPKLHQWLSLSYRPNLFTYLLPRYLSSKLQSVSEWLSNRHAAAIQKKLESTQNTPGRPHYSVFTHCNAQQFEHLFANFHRFQEITTRVMNQPTNEPTNSLDKKKPPDAGNTVAHRNK